MAAGTTRKISAASARSHTRRGRSQQSFRLPLGLFGKIVVAFFIVFLAWAYKAIQPPSPKICGSANGPPITASRIKLSDGRHLAYKEHGVEKDKAKYKIVYIHGFDSCRHDAVAATELSKDIVEDLGVYIVSFDRPGYGESDPHPKRSLKSMALDIEELADQLGLGLRFYVVGFSMGGEAVWPLLKYIPHRLSGAVLLAPVTNYWWPSFPSNISRKAFYEQVPQDQWAVGISHYAPWLTYWWNTQNWFPSSSVIDHNPSILSRRDMELLPKFFSRFQYQAQIRQQGEYETLHRDMMVGFGNWEFDPMELENPFVKNEGSVHLWQGDEDKLVPVSLQRYVAQKLPWIHYHELNGSGHMFPFEDGMMDEIIKQLLISENS